MLKIHNLNKTYTQTTYRFKFPLFTKTTDVKHIIKNISFEVQKGECVGLLGRNGAGKSTLIKLICGLQIPDNGEITFNGVNPRVYKHNLFNSIAVVFGQKSSLWWDLPVIDSLNAAKFIYQIEGFEERLSFLIESLSLRNVLNQPVRSLSLGERVKSELAFNLLHKPQLILLDEPTIGLDIISKRKLRDFLNLIVAKDQSSIIITSHDVGDIKDCCSKIILLDEGKIVFNDSIQQFEKIITSSIAIFKFTVINHILNEYDTNFIEVQVNKISGIKNITFIKENQFIITVENSKLVNNVIQEIILKFNFKYIFSVEKEDPSFEESMHTFFEKGIYN